MEIIYSDCSSTICLNEITETKDTSANKRDNVRFAVDENDVQDWMWELWMKEEYQHQKDYSPTGNMINKLIVSRCHSFISHTCVSSRQSTSNIICRPTSKVLLLSGYLALFDHYHYNDSFINSYVFSFLSTIISMQGKCGLSFISQPIMR